MQPVSRKTAWQLLLVFLVLIIFITVLGLFYYESQKKQIKKEKQDELMAIANLKVSQIVEWRKERLADALTIFDNFLLAPYVERLLQDPNRAEEKHQMLTWMKSLGEAYQYEDILLLDRKGNVLLSISQKNGGIETDVKGLVLEAARTRKIIFSDLYRSKASNRIHLSLIAPILRQEECGPSDIGVALLQINPYDFLYPLIESWPTPSPTAETMLVRREGGEVVFLSDLRHRKDTALTLRLSAGTPNLPAAIAVNGKKTISEGIDYRGEKVLAATRAIPDSPWFIVSKVDKEEVYAPIRQRLWNVMLLIGLCIISAGAGVILIWRRREAEEERRYRQYLEETVKERTGELERSNRRLEASYRDLESFSYAASHDLREPLIVIEWSSGNLLKKYGDKLDDEGREKLTTISEKTRQLTHFIGDLLSFSRVSTREIEKSDIDMEALAKNVAEEIKATLGDRNLELEIKSLPVAWGDPSMMRQVVINLLSNAFKYTRREETARIEIGGTEERAETIYYVKDNGIGFDEDASEKLFSLFKRLHASEEFEGTGIGLFIIKRVIEKHGGRVWAEGRINEGAIFYFSLPVGPRG